MPAGETAPPAPAPAADAAGAPDEAHGPQPLLSLRTRRIALLLAASLLFLVSDNSFSSAVRELVQDAMRARLGAALVSTSDG
jgi:hypothetical protein